MNDRQRRALEILAREDKPLHGGRLVVLLGERNGMGAWRGGQNTLEAPRTPRVRALPVRGHQQPSSEYEITAEGRAALA